ncbi:MAG: hypothetical protein PW735_02955 [Acidobacteriaceae bacterium]|nr:hypothetical protein [Acidobacteriaceae bacterium]
MHSLTLITTNWSEPLAVASYTTGVSLHSHTSVSQESLSFVKSACSWMPGLNQMLQHYGQRSSQRHGIRLDLNRAYWCPPLLPRMAYDVEARQIQRLWLTPLVSITDHDSMEAPLLLRAVPSSRHIPMSTEWSVPYGATWFHMGIHNLPSRDAVRWMERMKRFTEEADAARANNGDLEAFDRKLIEMIREMHESPQVLIVFNHPVWDLHRVGAATHRKELHRFLQATGRCIHALELNGLRHAQENRDVAQLARETDHLLISGGDRHGLEPNANVNLTTAATFTEFVEEVRVDRRSHVHFMDQYQRRWEQRILESTLNAITDFPNFLPGWQRWDDRAFHPDANGEMRSLRELWPDGDAPRGMRAAIHFVRMGGRNRAVAAPLRLAFPGVNRLGAEGF